MEECIDSNCMESENDASKTCNIKTCCRNCSFSSNAEEKNKCKVCCKVSRARKKIASQERWSFGRSDMVENVTPEKTKRHLSSITQLNVLKHVTDTIRQSVQKKTKIIKRNVPDRLGKYVSSSVRSETKSLIRDCKVDSKSSSNECFSNSNSTFSNESSKLKFSFDGCAETKLALLGNECLNTKEAVSLRNSFESDLETKNIFENFFDDCLDSTSKERDVSSQGSKNLERKNESLSLDLEAVGKYNCLLESLESFEKNNMKLIENEKTPEKKTLGTSVAPVKVKDHGNYHSGHKSLRHVCAYCHKIFKSNGKLNSHVYSHTGERPFDCSHCGKAFSSKFKLVRHLLIHSEVRKFVCQICDRTFLRNDHLKNHYKVHDPQKKMYKCPKENCDKEYSSIMSHKKHMAYHNVEDGDLKCLICNVKYETKEEILFHLKSHSGSRLFKSQSDKKFKCDFCERLFLTRKDVTRHLVVHTGERDFLCQFCPQRFGRKDHLVRHIKKSHHGNVNLSVKNETDEKGSKEEVKNSVEINSKLNRTVNKCLVKDSSDVNENNSGNVSLSRWQIPLQDSTIEEDDIRTKKSSNKKTHIVVTVQERSVKNSRMPNRKRKMLDAGNKKKPFHKNVDCVVPKKKQVPLAKGKKSTTQILLQNIPNILIIPNNSIILVRNQAANDRNKCFKTVEEVVTGESDLTCRPLRNEQSETQGNLLESSETLANPTMSEDLPQDNNFNMNFNYDSNVFQSPSHFLGTFPENDNFCNFQTDLSSFCSQFDESDHMNFEILNHGDLFSRPEVGLNSVQTVNCTTIRNDCLTNGNLLTETSRQIKLLETGMNTISTVSADKSETGKPEKCEDLFQEGNEALTLNETILNDFKDESSAILSTDNDIGVLSNILNQSNDNCGFELLRNLLTSENTVLSPLPGFNQIFHNSNTNSS